MLKSGNIGLGFTCALALFCGCDAAPQALGSVDTSSTATDDGTGETEAESDSEGSDNDPTTTDSNDTTTESPDSGTEHDSDSGNDHSDHSHPNLDPDHGDYLSDRWPDYFEIWDMLDNEPKDNPVTNAGATLGRVLFYDRQLSRSRTRSCGSCHDASSGMSDAGRALSEGEDGYSRRHTPALVNVRWSMPNELGGDEELGSMYWDGRAKSIEQVVLSEFVLPDRLAIGREELEERVRRLDYYDRLFAEAFGDSQVNSDRIARAIAQFLRAYVSYRTPFDRALVEMKWNNGKIFGEDLERAGLSRDAARGWDIFHYLQCDQCHGMFNALWRPMFSNNGINPGKDAGVGFVTERPQDYGRFKAPQLREIAKTGPYMHDGRFETLGEVVRSYSDGGYPHENRDPRIAEIGELSDQNVKELTAFLESLEDPFLRSDPRFSDPF